jgi:hypothetical protein
LPGDAVFAATSGTFVGRRVASHHAIPAAARFKDTAANVVIRMPAAGSNTKPAASAPAAAPMVFAV